MLLDPPARNTVNVNNQFNNFNNNPFPSATGLNNLNNPFFTSLNRISPSLSVNQFAQPQQTFAGFQQNQQTPIQFSPAQAQTLLAAGINPWDLTPATSRDTPLPLTGVSNVPQKPVPIEDSAPPEEPTIIIEPVIRNQYLTKLQRNLNIHQLPEVNSEQEEEEDDESDDELASLKALFQLTEDKSIEQD